MSVILRNLWKFDRFRNDAWSWIFFVPIFVLPAVGLNMYLPIYLLTSYLSCGVIWGIYWLLRMVMIFLSCCKHFSSSALIWLIFLMIQFYIFMQSVLDIFLIFVSRLVLYHRHDLASPGYLWEKGIKWDHEDMHIWMNSLEKNWDK